MRLQSLIEAYEPRHLVVDPLSALMKNGEARAAIDTTLRLLDLARVRGMTAVCTSLLAGDGGHEESMAAVSTLADTWIHLSYAIRGGERNRALTIVKSRGTPHSNQVRELILSDAGITLDEVYLAGGDVLMGTARREKEGHDEAERARLSAELERRRRRLALAEARTKARIAVLRRELKARRAELNRMEAEERRRVRRETAWRQELYARRGGSAARRSSRVRPR